MPIEWPGERTTARHDKEKDGSIQNWFGGLVDGMRDASGNMYMRNRYYDPATGQFTQADPIGLAGGPNAFGFANGDPVSYSDPYGLCATWQKLRHPFLCARLALGLLGAHPDPKLPDPINEIEGQESSVTREPPQQMSNVRFPGDPGPITRTSPRPTCVTREQALLPGRVARRSERPKERVAGECALSVPGWREPLPVRWLRLL